MPKIAIIGAHGTGKTTLAYEYATFLKKTEEKRSTIVLPELARYVKLHNKGKLNYGNYHNLYIVEQIAAELKAQAEDYHNIICDRSVLDPYIYSYPKGYATAYEDLVLEHLRTYDKIIFIRADKKKKLHNDGFRGIIKKDQLRIDALFLRILKENGIKYEEVINIDDFKFR